MTQRKRQRELLHIMLAASAGDATEEQTTRFSQLVVEDDSLAWHAARLLGQHAWLGLRGAMARAADGAVDSDASELSTAEWPADFADVLAAEHCQMLADVESPVGEEAVRPAAAPGASCGGPAPWRQMGWVAPAIVAATLFFVGAFVGRVATRWDISPGQGRVATADTVAAGDDAVVNAPFPSPYAARFVQATACVWGPGTVPPSHYGGRLRSGESINLMEGLADIEVDLTTGGTAKLQIEGPARMFLTTDGFPSLTLGKFSAVVHPGFGDFALETPFGQVFVEEESSLGIAIHGLEVEVHVFSGAVELASPWTSDLNNIERFTIRAGESFRLAAADGAAMKSTRGVADPASFASQTTMVSDRLRVPDSYVREIERAAPLVYWRFEDAVDGVIRNEVSDCFHGVMAGAPGWSMQDGNQAIEFGTGLTSESLRAYVEASDTFGDLIDDDYTVELWVKPSHYHLGTLISLGRNSLDDSKPGTHGMLLELGGPLMTPSTIEHPGRIRFLHRDPPSDDPSMGTSIFSDTPYELRRWTYVVAKKQGPKMQLYVNGRQVAEAEDFSELPDNLTVLIGQLDRHRGWRRFVGQLDELAIYNRALREDEIRSHFELIRPSVLPHDTM